MPWALLCVVLSCAGTSVPPVTPGAPAPGAAASPDRLDVKSVAVEELVIKGKDGKPRGKLTADGLTLADANGNTIAITLGDTSTIVVAGSGGAFKVELAAGAKLATVSTAGGGSVAGLGVQENGSVMALGANKRRLVAGVEDKGADLEMFDDSDKRRASFGLNSNGQPRLALYDSAENRRLYGILDADGAPVLDFNDKTGQPAVMIYGADAKVGSGMVVMHGNKPAATFGVGTNGKKQP